jgi:polyphosphate glucokinase
MPGETVLAVDVGGSHVKLLLSGSGVDRRRFESGPELTPEEMVDGTLAAATDWSYDVVSRSAYLRPCTQEGSSPSL